MPPTRPTPPANLWGPATWPPTGPQATYLHPLSSPSDSPPSSSPPASKRVHFGQPLSTTRLYDATGTDESHGLAQTNRDIPPFNVTRPAMRAVKLSIRKATRLTIFAKQLAFKSRGSILWTIFMPLLLMQCHFFLAAPSTIFYSTPTTRKLRALLPWLASHYDSYDVYTALRNRSAQLYNHVSLIYYFFSTRSKLDYEFAALRNRSLTSRFSRLGGKVGYCTFISAPIILICNMPRHPSSELSNLLKSQRLSLERKCIEWLQPRMNAVRRAYPAAITRPHTDGHRPTLRIRQLQQLNDPDGRLIDYSSAYQRCESLTVWQSRSAPAYLYLQNRTSKWPKGLEPVTQALWLVEVIRTAYSLTTTPYFRLGSNDARRALSRPYCTHVVRVDDTATILDGVIPLELTGMHPMKWAPQMRTATLCQAINIWGQAMQLTPGRVRDYVARVLRSNLRRFLRVFRNSLYTLKTEVGAAIAKPFLRSIPSSLLSLYAPDLATRRALQPLVKISFTAPPTIAMSLCNQAVQTHSFQFVGVRKGPPQCTCQRWRPLQPAAAHFSSRLSDMPGIAGQVGAMSAKWAPAPSQSSACISVIRSCLQFLDNIDLDAALSGKKRQTIRETCPKTSPTPFGVDLPQGQGPDREVPVSM
eukprot:g4258.t1